MRSISDIVGGIELTAVRGRVMGAQTWSETHVKGSGSAVMIKGIGAGSSRTTSTVVNKREVCVEAEDGVQIVEAFGADKVVLMPDQDVTLIRALKAGMTEPVTVGVRNHSMRKSMTTGKDVFESMSLLLGAAPFVTIAAVFTVAMGMNANNSTAILIGFVPLFGNFYWFRASAIREAFAKRVEEAMKAAADEPKPAAAALRSA